MEVVVNGKSEETISDDAMQDLANKYLAASVLQLTCRGGRGLGPSPKRVKQILQGIGPKTVTISAESFRNTLLCLEKAHPGAINRWFGKADLDVNPDAPVNS